MNNPLCAYCGRPLDEGECDARMTFDDLPGAPVVAWHCTADGPAGCLYDDPEGPARSGPKNAKQVRLALRLIYRRGADRVAVGEAGRAWIEEELP